MSPLSGIRRRGKTVAKKIYLPEEIAGKVELLIADPMRQKPKYGALSVLVTHLLTEYFKRLEQPDAPSFPELIKEMQDDNDK